MSLAISNTRVSLEKLVALLLGITVAISTTNVLYSLTENRARGFDFHFSEVLMIMTLALAWRFKLLQTPQFFIRLICTVFIISTAWSVDPSLTGYSSIKFALIFMGISSLRGLFKQENINLLLIPILAIIIAHAITAVYQASILGAVRPGGLAGNPNLLAGVALIFGPATGAILIAMTGTRAALLALVISLPLIGWKYSWRYAIVTSIILSVSIVISTLTFGSFGRVAQTIPVIQDLNIDQLSRGSPEGFTDSQRGEQFSRDTRDIGWIGTGFDTQTGVGVNPHNIYLIILQEMGWMIGLLVLIIFGLHLYYERVDYVLIPILIIGWFDHYWLTTAQGMYLFAMVLAGFKFWEDKLD